jgi:uncharacterized protein (TIGR02145 family)
MENDNGDRWLVDDIKVDSQCLTPTGLSAVPLSTSATVSWTSPNPAGPWQIEYGPAGFTQGTTGPAINIVNATSNSTVINGLNPLTNYDFYVRMLCDVDNPSPWSIKRNFTTTSLPPVCGGNFIDEGGPTGNYPANENRTVTIVPSVPGEVVTVTFTSFSTEVNSDALYVYDGPSTASPLLSSGNPAGFVPGGLAGGYWGTAIPGPFASSHASGALTFVFRSDGSQNRAGWTSNVSCSTCPPPSFTQVPAICSGGSLAALPTTSTNGITGTWSPALNTSATTTYTFTPSNSLCSTTASMTITVNPNVIPAFTQVAPICFGVTINSLPTTSTNGITGTWSPELNNTATTTYTFTPTVGQCANTTTMTIVVNDSYYTFYVDADGDGIGAGAEVYGCLDEYGNLPPGYSSDNYDCNDNDANFLLPSNWYGNVYIDADGDGFGSGNPTSTCMSWDYNLPQGYSWNNYDCDDHFFSSNGLCPLTLNIKLYLQGYYKSNQNQMTPLRKNARVSPSQDEVDEVTVSLYSKYDVINPIIAAATAVVGTNGIVGLKFAVLPDEYYILVEHKNTIKTWSATPVAITNGTTYDFTTAASQAYGNNQIEVASGIYAIYSGDMNQDGTINEADLPIFTIANTTAAHGYVVSDLNGDGSVDLLDYPIYKNNAAASVNAVRPVPLPIASLPNVTIGTQVWQSTNLNVATYRDGTPIPQVTDPTAWANLTTGAWCYYNNTIANDTTYGKLYNWYAVAGIHDNDPNTPNKILAPEGWHVPTDAEWTKLTTFLGGDNVAGGKMKATGTSLWLSPNTGATNSSSFTGLPAGCRLYGGTFGNGGAYCDWWSSSESEGSTTSALNRYLGYGNGNAWRGSRNKGNGFSVRCLRD